MIFHVAGTGNGHIQRFTHAQAGITAAGNIHNSRFDRTFGVNVKLTWMGGHREAPIDLAASAEQGKTVRDENRAFEERMPDYFHLDTGFRIRRNYEHMTTTLSLDIQNTTNRENVFGRYYDDKSDTVKYSYQAPLIPILGYKLEF